MGLAPDSVRQEAVAAEEADRDPSARLCQPGDPRVDEGLESRHCRAEHGHAEVEGRGLFRALRRRHPAQRARAMVEPRRRPRTQQFEDRSFSLQLGGELRARLRIVARADAVAPRSLDVGILVVADVKGGRRVDALPR